MIFFGSIEAEVIHKLVSAYAVNEEVELNVSGILAKELDVDLIVRIRNAVLGVIRTCANKECACSTGVSRGLHGNYVVTVVIVVLCASLTCSVVKFYLCIVKPSSCLLLGDAKSHNAVFIVYVVTLPNYVENVTV